MSIGILEGMFSGDQLGATAIGFQQNANVCGELAQTSEATMTTAAAEALVSTSWTVPRKTTVNLETRKASIYTTSPATGASILVKGANTTATA